MPRETYSALTVCLFLCCSLDLCEVRHIAALSMICLLSYIMAMQELNTWKEIAKFLAWASGLFSVAGVSFRSADSEESYELPNPLPFLEWYSFSPAPCPMMTQLDRWTERRAAECHSPHLTRKLGHVKMLKRVDRPSSASKRHFFDRLDGFDGRQTWFSGD